MGIQPKWVGAEWAGPTLPWAPTLQSGKRVPRAPVRSARPQEAPGRQPRAKSGDSGGGARDRRGTYGPEVRQTEAIALSRPGS